MKRKIEGVSRDDLYVFKDNKKTSRVIEVRDRSNVSCDGKHGGDVAHPLVYLKFGDDEDSVQCGYCDTVFKVVR